MAPKPLRIHPLRALIDVFTRPDYVAQISRVYDLNKKGSVSGLLARCVELLEQELQRSNVYAPAFMIHGGFQYLVDEHN